MSSSTPLHTYKDLFKELYELIGSKIRFKTTDGEYEGMIKDVLPKSQRVIVEDVYYVPTRDYMGNLNFFLPEFISYSAVESVDKFEKYERWDYVSRILERKFIGKQYSISDVLNQSFDEESESGESIPCADDFFVDDFVMILPDNLRNKLPHDCLILENTDEEFDQAIHYISQQTVIGVSFEGPKISRLGKLTWLCISTPYCVFLFDIESLGKDAFDNGLRDIFQNRNIEKVIHDSREPSDCLCHLFGTKLVKVFDTQAADFIINAQRYSDKPDFKHVSSLDCCLVYHLDVPQEFLYNREKHLSYADEVTFFQIRPINNDYRNAVIKNVVYLVLLKETLDELMLTPFRKAVDVYLNVLANASEPELFLDVSVPEMIPPALVMQGIETLRFQDASGEAPVIPLVCTFKSSESSTVVKYSRPSNIEPENTSSEEVMNSKSDMFAGNNFCNKSIAKKTDVSNQNINFKKDPDTEQVVEHLSMQNSKNHMDNLYHQLVKSLSNASESVDVKPSQDYVSNFVDKKSSILKAATIENTESSTVHSKPSNIGPKNASAKIPICGKKDMVKGDGITKNEEVSNQNNDSQGHSSTQRAVIKQLIMQHSQEYRANLYNQVVSSRGNSSESVDVNPSQDCVSNFVKKSPFLKAAAIENTLVSNLESNKSEFCNLTEIVSKHSDADNSTGVSADNSAGMSADSSDTWEILRSTFGVSSSETEKFEYSKKKLRFLPAGMNA